MLLCIGIRSLSDWRATLVNFFVSRWSVPLLQRKTLWMRQFKLSRVTAFLFAYRSYEALHCSCCAALWKHCYSSRTQDYSFRHNQQEGVLRDAWEAKSDHRLPSKKLHLARVHLILYRWIQIMNRSIAEAIWHHIYPFVNILIYGFKAAKG